MTALYPCPGCGQNRQADEGHALCRQCEGYAVVLRDQTALLRGEVDDLGWENEQLRAERDALRERLEAVEGALRVVATNMLALEDGGCTFPRVIDSFAAARAALSPQGASEKSGSTSNGTESGSDLHVREKSNRLSPQEGT